MTAASDAVPKYQPLAAAIDLARRGRKHEARQILQDVCEHHPGNATAWLWRASVAETVSDAVQYLRRVLVLEPGNKTAREWYARLRPTVVPVEVFYCFLCGHESREDFTSCLQCGAVLSLDVEATVDRKRQDDRKIRAAAERLNRTEDAAGSFETQYYLGVATLNLLDTYSALRHFRRAAELDPRGAGLGGVIDALSRRPLIMAVDDCQTIRSLVSTAIERNGYRCLAIGSAVDALSYLEEESPQFVLLDVTMPFMDGYMLCKAIKARPKTKNTAVVMLSGREGFLDKVKARMAGASDYLTKPFEPALLMRLIRKYVN